jgi:hypothetical protein
MTRPFDVISRTDKPAMLNPKPDYFLCVPCHVIVIYVMLSLNVVQLSTVLHAFWIKIYILYLDTQL